jgi:methionyl-tRNA formyltransferase
MKIVFMGTPDFAVNSLELLLKSSKHEVLAVVTQPDRPKGRGKKILMTPIKETAIEAKVKVFQPNKVKSPEFVEILKQLNPDLIVVAAFGQFLSQEILDLPKYGCINVHASLLPKYRGAAPIHYAILNGEKKTGVTIMKMDIGMDTGDMIDKVEVPITENMTMGELHDELKLKGAELLLEVIDQIENGTAVYKKQNNDEATYASLLDRSMEKIDWSKSAVEIHNKICAFNPWPGTFTKMPNGKTLKIWKTIAIDKDYDLKPGTIVECNKNYFSVATGKGTIEVYEVQPESKRKMLASVFINGHNIVEKDELFSE